MGINTLTLHHAPSEKDFEKNTPCSVTYTFENAADARVDDNFNGYNGGYIKQASIAVFEYYHPGIKVLSLDAMLIKCDTGLCPVITFTFVRSSDKLKDVCKMSNPAYVQYGKFQPLYGSIHNIVNAIMYIKCDQDSSFAFTSNLPKVRDSVTELITDKIKSANGYKLPTETYMSQTGIMCHVVHFKNFCALWHKFSETELSSSEFDELMIAVITDICNGATVSTAGEYLIYMIPTIHVCHSDNDIFMVIDYMKGMNFTINEINYDDEDRPTDVTLGNIRIDSYSRNPRNGQLTAYVKVTQTDNVREFTDELIHQMINKFMNCQGVVYSVECEWNLATTRPGKYIPFHGHNVLGDLKLLGTPVYSIYDGSLPKREITDYALTPCFGSVFAINDIISSECKSDQEGSSRLYVCALDMKVLAPSLSVKNAITLVGPNNVFTLQYMMLHTCIFKAKKSNIIVIGLPPEMTHMSCDDYLLTHCKNMRFMTQGELHEFAPAIDVGIYYMKGD